MQSVKPDVNVGLLHVLISPSAIIGICFFIFMNLFFIWVLRGVELLTSLSVIAFVFLIFAARTSLDLLNLKYTEYRLASEGVYLHEGFFTRREKFVPTKRITDVRLIQKWPVDTWMNTGSIVLESAGFSSSIVLQTIANPRKYYEIIKELTLKS